MEWAARWSRSVNARRCSLEYPQVTQSLLWFFPHKDVTILGILEFLLFFLCLFHDFIWLWSILRHCYVEASVWVWAFETLVDLMRSLGIFKTQLALFKILSKENRPSFVKRVAPLLRDLRICSRLSLDHVELNRSNGGWWKTSSCVLSYWFWKVIITQWKSETTDPTVSSVTVERWCLVTVSYLINLVTSRLRYTKAIR